MTSSQATKRMKNIFGSKKLSIVKKKQSVELLSQTDTELNNTFLVMAVKTEMKVARSYVDVECPMIVYN